MAKSSAKKDEAQAEVEAVPAPPEQPAAPAEKPQEQSAFSRFTSAFANTAGGFSQLKWGGATGSTAIITSNFGRLLHADGSVVELPPIEAQALVGKLSACRPNDKIQAITL